MVANWIDLEVESLDRQEQGWRASTGAPRPLYWMGFSRGARGSPGWRRAATWGVAACCGAGCSATAGTTFASRILRVTTRPAVSTFTSSMAGSPHFTTKAFPVSSTDAHVHAFLAGS